jgi:hypothetical protein
MPDDAELQSKWNREKLEAVLRNASEELLAEGDAEGARIAVDALKELRKLGEAEPPSPPHKAG